MNRGIDGVLGHRVATGLALAAVLAFGATGCASKKYVRTRVDPVQTKVDNIDTQVQQHGKSIDEMEKGLSKTDERVTTVDGKAQKAQAAADAADQKAADAGQRAGQANELASNAKSRADEAYTGIESVGKRIDKLHQYNVAFEDSVLFKFESAQLTDESKKKLDEVATKLNPDSGYEIEVTGFTDKSGGANYNLALSEQRAQAVVRYLNTQHNIPLHRIHVMGFGADNPVAKNETREGRKMNRRVQIKLYTAGGEKTAEAGKVTEQQQASK